nr:hypothetical protein [Tanacetum cinerariifolium]
MTKKPSILRRNKVNWHYVRYNILFSTIKVVSRHQNTQQYGAILPTELTTEDIRNTKAYKEYYACATGEAAPKPKASARRKRGGSDSSTTPPTVVAFPRPITTVAAAPRLTAVAKGKQPARATSPNDPSEVERTEAEQLKIVLRRSRQETRISQHGGSSTDEGTDVDDQDKGRDDDEGEKNDESDADDDDDDDNDEEEIPKLDEQKDTENSEGDAEETKSDEESAEEETREEEEESFFPIPRTPEDSEDDGNGEENQVLRVSEGQRLIEEEEADELYCDVDINQGMGLQVSQDIEDSHVTLTPVKPDGQQESSSVSSFVTSMLNPISDAGVESIFTTASSPIAPLQTSTPIMTPSTIAIITTSSDAPIPPTIIPSAVLQNLPTFDSVFRFEDRVNSLEVNFSEFMQTNQFAEAVSNIPDKTILESYRDTAILKRRHGDDDDQEGPSAGSDRGSKRRREGGEPESASTPSEPATRSASRSTTGTQSRQMSASESAFAEEPPRKPPTPDRDWNKTLPAVQGSAQTWINELSLLLIPDNQGHRVISFAHFINNDLEYLRGGASSRKYTTSVTKTKAADYGHIKWIEDLVPRTMWIQEPLNYEKHTLWGVSHWGWKRQQFYGFAVNRESALDVYSKRRIIDVTDLKIVEWHNYIGKLSNLTVEERFAFNVSLRMFTRSIVIQWRVEDLQLGVESYQKRLNLTKPDTY